MFVPKLLTTLKDYSWRQFRTDAMAGVIVGIVALPLAIAFAIASGVTPDRGLTTAVVAGFLISALGGSRVQIGGPTGAFVVIIYGIVQHYGVDGLIVATFLGGILLVGIGFAGLGNVIKFIPYPVTVGFTSGIALIIFSSQMKDFFGLNIEHVPAEFFEKWKIYAEHAATWNPYAFVISFLTVIIVLGWKRISLKIPGSLVALLLMTAAAKFFNLPVETIGSRFGEIPHTLSAPQWPQMNFQMFRELLPSAFAIALLAGIESLLSAVVADGMIGGKHRSNMELVAQGVANIASALFGGMPATGAIARTATNVHNGGRTPIAGIIHAATLFFIMFSFGQWAKLIPLACLAGILVVVAYHMSEWHSFLMILRAPKSDIVVLLITFFLTVAVDLTFAIEVGVVLAALLLVRQLSMTSNIGVYTREFKDEEEGEDPNAISKRQIPEGVEVYEVNGPFFFGVASSFLEMMKNIERKPKARILRMRHALTVDATAINVLRQAFKECKKKNVVFILSGVHAQPLFALDRAGLLDEIGRDNVCAHIDESLNRVREILSLPPVEKPSAGIAEVKRETSSAEEKTP